MVQLTQDKRIAQLQTPLGKDVLVLASFVATEGLSELFEINVAALSEEENITGKYFVETGYGRELTGYRLSTTIRHHLV